MFVATPVARPMPRTSVYVKETLRPSRQRLKTFQGDVDSG